MLDEPTDHLDAEARALLLAGLRSFTGIGIIVSHDRALLSELTSYTVRLHEGGARLWRGEYGLARQSWEAEEREHLETYQRTREEHRKVLRRLADKRRINSAADPRVSLQLAVK